VLGALLLIGLTTARAGAPADTSGNRARHLLREARLAVEGDSAPALMAGWSARLAADAGDRAALLGLATASRLTYDDSTAARLYERVLRHSPGRLDGYAVYAYLGMARLAYDRTDMSAADSLARAALAGARTSHDRTAEGEAFLAVADARMDADAGVGMAYLDSAGRAPPTTATELVAEVGCRRARLAFRSGALSHPDELTAALVYTTRVGARQAEAQCLRTVAIDLFTRGQNDSAVVLLRRSTDLLREGRDRRLLAFTLTVLAEVLRDRGSYGDARAAAYESLEQASASRHVSGEALATQMLGTLAYSLRDIPTAARQFDRAYALYGTLNDSADQMNVRSWQANIARDEGDLPRARRLTGEVIAEARREHAVPWTVDLYQALADIEILARDWQAAAAALDTAELILRRHGTETWRGKLDYQRARLALRRGDLAAADAIFRGYLRELGAEDRLREHETRAYLAEIQVRRGDLAAAERELTAAGDALDAWRASLGDEELRRFAFQATATDESDQNASVPRVLAAIAAGGRPDAAFALAERRRARELGDRLLAASALEPRDAQGEGSRGRSPDGAITRTTSAAGIARLLPDDRTALVEYLTGALGAPTTAFVITRRGGSARAYLLPPADSLAGSIGRFVGLVSKGELAAGDARALGTVLLEPVLRELGAEITRLVIVPDGPLHRVPWDALRLSDGHSVVERYAVGLAPSAGALAVLWGHPPETPPADSLRLLAMGDPRFARLTGQDAELVDAAGGLPSLPGSGAEARRVARYAPRSELRLGADASAAYLLHAPLLDFQVLHLATHAFVDDRALGRTALALAPGGAVAVGGGSGLVTPGELSRLRLRAALVVLSACRTAGGVVVDGEGIQGLTAPLLEAGARSVVATSWRVGDRSTARFVDAFYAAMAKRQPIVEALRAAKLGAMRDGAPPSVWAAFDLVGDPVTLVPVTAPRSRTAWWVGAGGLFVLAIVATLRRRRPGAGDGARPDVRV
jgi:CHAT domain-containing protein